MTVEETLTARICKVLGLKDESAHNMCLCCRAIILSLQKVPTKRQVSCKMEFIDDKKDAGQSQRSNVIVRVKRKRTEEPTNSLCIVEDVRERKRIGLSN